MESADHYGGHRMTAQERFELKVTGWAFLVYLLIWGTLVF